MMKNFKRYTSVALTGLVLAGTLGLGFFKGVIDKKETLKEDDVYPKHLQVGIDKMLKLGEHLSILQYNKEIEEISCLFFDKPVEAIKLYQVGKNVALDLGEVMTFGDKWEQLGFTKTDLVLTTPVKVYMTNEESNKVEDIYAYRDLRTGDLVMFPHGVTEAKQVPIVAGAIRTKNIQPYSSYGDTADLPYKINDTINFVWKTAYSWELSFPLEDIQITAIKANVDMTNPDFAIFDSYVEETSNHEKTLTR